MINRMRILKSSSGVTILESLMAIAIVMVMMFVSISFFIGQNSKARTLSVGGACKIALETQMNYFRQQSVAPFSMKWSVDPNDITREIVDSKNFVDPWLGSLNTPTVSDLVEDSNSSLPPIVYTPYLQRGLMGTLGALYNSSKLDLCSNSVNINEIVGAAVKQPLMVSEDVNDLTQFTSKIQIQTYLLNDPTSSAGCTQRGNLWLRPQGKTSAVGQNIIRFPTGVSDQYGYRVTLTGYFVDKDKNTKNCSLSEDFRYPIDHEVQKPSMLVNNDDIENSISIGGQSTYGYGGIYGSTDPKTLTCPNPYDPYKSNRPLASHPLGTQAHLKLEVGFENQKDADLEPGTVFMCRDVSIQRNPNYCMMDKKGNRTSYDKWGIGAAMDGSSPAPNSPWVSCAKVTVCGVPQSGNSKFDSKMGKYTLDYESAGLWGCDVRMDVATVDAAGNFKKISDYNAAGNKKTASEFGQEVTRKYFQGPDCYACAKKKPFGILGIIKIVAVAVSGGLTGVGILCGLGGCSSGSGYSWKRNSATNNPKKGEKCKTNWFKAPQTFPDWWIKDRNPACLQGSSGSFLSCPILSGTYPGTAVQYTIPAGVEGSFADIPVYSDSKNGTYCAIQAECENGKWQGPEMDNGQRAPMESCGKIVTQMKLDISSLSAGAPASSAQAVPVCTLAMPNGGIIDPVRKYYDAYQVCSKFKTGESSDLLCKIIPPNVAGGTETFEFPIDPMTTAPADPDNNYYPTYAPIRSSSQPYTYFEHRLPLDSNLRPCGTDQ